MTYDDDFVRLCFDHGVVNQPCKALGLAWPPPEEFEAMGFKFRRVRFSKITDEQRAGMTHVMRGAEYEVQS
jgi:hypothetical protein